MASLIKTVAELKEYLAGAQKNLSEATILPYVEQAEIAYLEPVLGPEFIDELQTAHNSAGGGSEAQKDAIRLLQRSLAYYTLLEAVPYLTVSVGNAGLQESSTQTSAPVRQWAMRELVAATSNNADRFLDLALAYLEKNASDYPTWHESEAYTVSHDLLISSAAQLSRYIHINNSRRAYLALRPFIRRVEDLYLLPTIGQALYAELAYPGGPATFYRGLVVALCQKALANLALAESLPEIGLTLTGNGISIVSDTSGLLSFLKADLEEKNALKQKAESTGKAYLAELKRYLDENAASIPAYQASTAYSGGTPRRYELPDNSNKPTFRV